MRKWQKVLDLKDVWNPDMEESEVPALGLTIAKRLIKLYPEWEDDFDLFDIVESFKSVLSPDEIATGEYCIGSTKEDFNNSMAMLYDYADANNLWVATRF